MCSTPTFDEKLLAKALCCIALEHKKKNACAPFKEKLAAKALCCIASDPKGDYTSIFTAPGILDEHDMLLYTHIRCSGSSKWLYTNIFAAAGTPDVTIQACSLAWGTQVLLHKDVAAQEPPDVTTQAYPLPREPQMLLYMHIRCPGSPRCYYTSIFVALGSPGVTIQTYALPQEPQMLLYKIYPLPRAPQMLLYSHIL